MVSIKRYIQQPSLDANCLKSLVELLLDCVAQQLPSLDPAEHESFQCGVRSLQAELGAAERQEQVAFLGAKVTELVDGYSRKVEKLAASEQNELKSMVVMMTQSLVRVSQTSHASVATLHAVERDLTNASELPDILSVKAKLADSLKAICEEAARQKEQIARIDSDLSKAAGQPAGGIDTGVLPCDPVTGLAGIEAAHTRIAEAFNSGRNAWVAMFFLERMDAVNQRFGFKAGDQMMALFSKHIAKQLKENDSLFRWRGPLLVAVLEREQSALSMGTEIRRIAMSQPEFSLTTGARDVIIPMASSYSVIGLKSQPGVDAVIKCLEGFASNERNRTQRTQRQ